jgi:hypothetical protein
MVRSDVRGEHAAGDRAVACRRGLARACRCGFKLTVVASDVDPATERIVAYLNAGWQDARLRELWPDRRGGAGFRPSRRKRR